MARILAISNSQIIKSLEGVSRQYLVGELARPQVLDYIHDSKLEIGITSYDSYSHEASHAHAHAFEYQYVISGFTCYLDLDSREELFFRKGDFYIIEPGVKYAQKSKPGTAILFIKIPPGNDKTLCHQSEDVLEWLNSRIVTKREDFSANKDAPLANAIKPAAAVALFDGDKLLVLKRKDSGNWTLPGGTQEFGESLLECACRETKEETGLDIKISGIIGTYTDPRHVVKYSDGEVRQEFSILYSGEIVSGKTRLDDESTELKWVTRQDIFALPLADSQKIRLQDVFEHLDSGKIFLR